MTDVIVFTGDSILGSDAVNINEGSMPVRLDFSGLGEGISIDMSATGQQTLNDLLNLTLSTGDNAVGVIGTAYDDTIQSGPNPALTVNGGVGNDTLVANGPCTLVGGSGGNTFVVNVPPTEVTILPGAGFNSVEVNDPTGNDPGLAQTGWDGIQQVVVNDSNGTGCGFFNGGNISDADIPTGANVTVSGETQLDLGGDPVSLGSLTLEGGTIFGGAITATLVSIDGGSIYADSITATSLSLNGGSVYADLHGAWGLTQAATSRSRAQTISAAAPPSSTAARSNWPVPRHCLRRGRSRSWAAARWRWSAARTIGRGATSRPS